MNAKSSHLHSDQAAIFQDCATDLFMTFCTLIYIYIYIYIYIVPARRSMGARVIIIIIIIIIIKFIEKYWTRKQ